MMASEQVKVLDHGYVQLIDKMGSDESVVEAARMSTGKGFISWDPYDRCDKCELVIARKPNEALPFAHKSEGEEGSCFPHKWASAPNGDLGLLDNLWRKRHATPFEMGILCIQVQAPIMVFREWHRHRTQSFNEFSARYAIMPNLHYLPDASRIQKQSTANKQGSAGLMGAEFTTECLSTLEEEQRLVYEEYEYMAEQGLAREVARINTPVSRYSKMRASGNIRNWFQFLNLRMRPDAQWEIRMYANEVAKLIQTHWPKAYALFEEYDLYAAHFSRSELRLIREKCMVDFNLPMEVVEKELGSKAKANEFMAKLRDGGEKILS